MRSPCSQQLTLSPRRKRDGFAEHSQGGLRESLEGHLSAPWCALSHCTNGLAAHFCTDGHDSYVSGPREWNWMRKPGQATSARWRDL